MTKVTNQKQFNEAVRKQVIDFLTGKHISSKEFCKIHDLSYKNFVKWIGGKFDYGILTLMFYCELFAIEIFVGELNGDDVMKGKGKKKVNCGSILYDN